MAVSIHLDLQEGYYSRDRKCGPGAKLLFGQNVVPNLLDHRELKLTAPRASRAIAMCAQ